MKKFLIQVYFSTCAILGFTADSWEEIFMVPLWPIILTLLPFLFLYEMLEGIYISKNSGNSEKVPEDFDTLSEYMDHQFESKDLSEIELGAERDLGRGTTFEEAMSEANNSKTETVEEKSRLCHECGGQFVGSSKKCGTCEESKGVKRGIDLKNVIHL